MLPACAPLQLPPPRSGPHCQGRAWPWPETRRACPDHTDQGDSREEGAGSVPWWPCAGGGHASPLLSPAVPHSEHPHDSCVSPEAQTHTLSYGTAITNSRIINPIPEMGVSQISLLYYNCFNIEFLYKCSYLIQVNDVI